MDFLPRANRQFQRLDSDARKVVRANIENLTKKIIKKYGLKKWFSKAVKIVLRFNNEIKRAQIGLIDSDRDQVEQSLEKAIDLEMKLDKSIHHIERAEKELEDQQ